MARDISFSDGSRTTLDWWAPLMLRLSFHRLWNATEHPICHLLFLLWPWRASIPVQLSPAQLIKNTAEVERRQEGIQQLHELPLFAWRDTPLRSVYRMYECICAGMNYLLKDEVTHFYFHPQAYAWRLKDIPDPQ